MKKVVQKCGLLICQKIAQSKQSRIGRIFAQPGHPARHQKRKKRSQICFSAHPVSDFPLKSQKIGIQLPPNWQFQNQVLGKHFDKRLRSHFLKNKLAFN
jgi:hypothetical protein